MSCKHWATVYMFRRYCLNIFEIRSLCRSLDKVSKRPAWKSCVTHSLVIFSPTFLSVFVRWTRLLAIWFCSGDHVRELNIWCSLSSTDARHSLQYYRSRYLMALRCSYANQAQLGLLSGLAERQVWDSFIFSIIFHLQSLCNLSRQACHLLRSILQVALRASRWLIFLDPLSADMVGNQYSCFQQFRWSWIGAWNGEKLEKLWVGLVARGGEQPMGEFKWIRKMF